jgi:hypothetical protein
MSDAEVMTGIVSRYMTRNTPFDSAGTGWQKLLDADPSRLWVQFLTDGVAGTTFAIIPGPIPDLWVPTGFTLDRIDYKFKDCPTVVTGEWYLYDTLLRHLLITECLFRGR